MAAAGGALPGGTRMTVRASQFIEKSGLWYEVSVGERRGWITAWEVSARYSFPVVHFVAGLYRYQLGRYLDAAREFEQYARADGVEADAASLSSAYQMLAASRMMAASATGELSKDATVREVNLALDQAQKTTPYDPGVFTLRAVTTLATRNSLDAALPHLNRALELDSENTDARRVLLRMNDVYVKPGDPGLQMFQRGIKEQPKVREDIRNLSERYRVAPR
jgi:tetratricopeptide (TPR) repeat protein